MCVCVFVCGERKIEVWCDSSSVFILRSDFIPVTLAFAFSLLAYFDGGWKPFFLFSPHSEGLVWPACVWLLPPGAVWLHHRLGMGAAAAVNIPGRCTEPRTDTLCLPLHIGLCCFQIYDGCTMTSLMERGEIMSLTLEWHMSCHSSLYFNYLYGWVQIFCFKYTILKAISLFDSLELIYLIVPTEQEKDHDHNCNREIVFVCTACAGTSQHKLWMYSTNYKV